MSLAIAAAIFAAFVALFLDAIKSWIWRPELEVTYVHGPDYWDKPLMRFEANGQVAEVPCYYLRLRIANKGTRRAEKVEVLATDLQMRQDDGSYALLRRYSMNLKWTNLGTAILDGISPGMERFCDIGHIIRPQDRLDILGENSPSFNPEQTILSFDVEAQPNHLTHLVEPGQYRLTLHVAASKNPPVEHVLDVELTGEWFEVMNDMLMDGVRVSLLSPSDIQDSVPA